MYDRHEEHAGVVAAPSAALFEHLDDQTRLSAHMSKRSWKMGWGKMETILDAQGGRAVGSHIVLRGRVLGILLDLDEVVTERVPPTRKTWETVGEPRLLVIGAYRIGFTITSRTTAASELCVTIDYDLPRRGLAFILGRLFGRSYARWCTRQMVAAAQHAVTVR